MANRTLALNDSLYRYVLDHSVHEHEVLAELRQETAQHPMGQMQNRPRTRAINVSTGAAAGGKKGAGSWSIHRLQRPLR